MILFFRPLLLLIFFPQNLLITFHLSSFSDYLSHTNSYLENTLETQPES
jgi:hypothetical protein